MTEAEFWRSVRETQPLIQDLALGPTAYRLHGQPTERFRKAALNPSVRYSELFLLGLSSRDYCYLLNDLSYFQFYWASSSRSPFLVRYGFYPNPFGFTSFEEFAEENGFDEDDPWAQEFYQQYMSEREPLDGIAPYRFEVDFEGYRPTLHPCAHLHIGHQTDVRWPVDKVLRPKTFALLMLKSHYPGKWSSSPTADPGISTFDKKLADAKDDCTDLDPAYFSKIERGQPHIT